MSGGARARWLAAIAVALGAGADARAASSACSAESRVEPSRAVPGQQVLYRVQIASRDDVEHVEWLAQPSFPGVRTEVLPGFPLPSRLRDGHPYAMREEQRAVFAEAAGRIVLRSHGLRCRVGGVEVPVPVPDAILDVVELPTEGRPAGFDGVIGPLTVLLNVTPTRIRIGESVRIAVMVRGAGNLWDLRDPFGPEDFPGSELFPRRPALHLERGEGLFVRRHFAYDLVPRETGTLLVPPLRVAYFDPVGQRFETAVQAATLLEVAPEPSRSPVPAAPSDTARVRAAPADSGGPGVWLVGVALVALLAFVGWRWAPRRGSAAPRPDAALAEAKRSREAGDRRSEAEWLARALRAGLARHVPDAATASAEEILARNLPGDPDSAAHLLAAVERSRFDPEAPPADAGAVERAIAALSGRR